MILGDTTLTVITNGPTGAKDRLGKDVIGETGRVVVEGCRLESSASVEGTEYVSSRWVAYLPEGTPITADDTVTDGVRTFGVDGSPEAKSIPGAPMLNHTVAVLTLMGA